MSLAPSPHLVPAGPDEASPRTFPWGKALLLGALFVWLYHYNLQRLWIKTNFITGDPNWSHSLCVPLIGLYYLFLRRDELLALPVRPLLVMQWTRVRWLGGLILIGLGAAMSLVIAGRIPVSDALWMVPTIARAAGWAIMVYGALIIAFDWGIATLLGGLLLSAYGIFPGRNDFVWDCGMIMTLFGVVLTLCGWAIMRIAWFPIVFLVCALPWPPLVYSQIASPLQTLAAKTAVVVLQCAGVDANVGGTKIFIPQYSPSGVRLLDRALNVEEACAGLRSLMTFISVAAAVAFLSSRPLWQKLIITFSAIPIAIACNVMRVTGQGFIDIHLGREWSEGFAHQFAGMVMLLPAFFMIMAVCWIVDHSVIEESEAPTPAAPPTKGATAGSGAGSRAETAAESRAAGGAA